MIYLDYNSTAPITGDVLAAMLPHLEQNYANPSSGHTPGRNAREVIERARSETASAIGAEPDEILFTSGGTEASNQAIKGTFLRAGVINGLQETPAKERPHLIISAVEHQATTESANFLKRFGVEVSVIGCDRQGVTSTEEFARAIRSNTTLASVMHANNEIGSVQPIRELADLCHDRDVLLHVDAAQSLGKIPVNVQELGADLLSIAGHKIYAPKGVGALFVRRGVEIESFMHGAGHERGLRAGTENTPYLVAFGKAMSLAREFVEGDGPVKMAKLRDRLAERLYASIGSEFSINAEQAPRLPNTLSANFPGVIGQELLQRCPEICASTGAACHWGDTRRSATLTAIDLPPTVAVGTVRMSLGRGTTEAEVDEAAQMLTAGWQSLRAAGEKKS
ncbi:MAG: cysteine desulfurase [Pirellulales bacterium]|nr:cysteine desulfurase [Pirellulales bacterium]